MAFVQLILDELGITLANGEVWLAIGLALLVGASSLAFGAWASRIVGLLGRGAPAGETLAVGLASGLMILAAWWAAVWSGGRSSFTPVAVGFLVAILLGLRTRIGRPRRSRAQGQSGSGGTRTPRQHPSRSLIVMLVGAAAFTVAAALLYGSTLAPSPRDGDQPTEFVDVAFYAVLGRDLATTGTEANYTPSGFEAVPGLPAQTWYHWGEIWLASAAITIFGTAPIAARYLIVLPLILLAAAALTGTTVRRYAETSSRRAYGFGFAACLFLAPVALVPGPFFSSWAVGLVFGITLYGMGAVAALLALYSVATLRRREASWPLAVFVGTSFAYLLPAHVVVALLALVGVGAVAAHRVATSLRAPGGVAALAPIWLRTLVATIIATVASAAWGAVTGHGLAGSVLLTTIPPFHWSWLLSMAIVILGAGIFLAIPVVMTALRPSVRQRLFDLCVAAIAILGVGAIAWGWRVGDFNMYHVFFAGLAVFGTPAATAGAWAVWRHVLARDRKRLAMLIVVVSALQLEIGVAASMTRLVQFGPHQDFPIPQALLKAIRELPADAKLGYLCRPFDESGFANPTLGSIDAHTGRRAVPLCFQADFLGSLIEGQRLLRMNPSFAWAPQRALFADASARPSSAAISAFMRANGIEYIYADPKHPNELVVDAVPVAVSGDAALLRLPSEP